MRWTHETDSDHLDFALTRATVGAWGEASGAKSVRVADLRTLIAHSAAHAERLRMGVFTLGAVVSHPDSIGSSSDERTSAARAILRTWALLTRSTSAGPPQPPPDELATASPAADAGAVPVAVAVVGALAATAVLIYGAYTAGNIVDRDLDREAQQEERAAQRADMGKALVQAQGAALEVLNLHHAREREAGKRLPFNAGERKALSALGKAQQGFHSLLKDQGDLPQQAPLPDPFKGIGAGFGASFGLLAVAGVLLFVISQKKG